jgi:outer membrane receptor protein involved in Fe transport
LDNIEDVLREPESNQILQSEWKKVDPHILLSPRLGFSFPVSETAVFYFQYGKFAQMPHLSRMYFGTQRLSRQILFGGNYYPGPIGFDLDPIKTTNYEVGFRKQVSNFAAFDVTGFYRNVKGQIQVIKQSVASSATIQAYDRYVNGDFATTKGLEFKLNLRRVNRIQAQFNYTLTDAEGTGSNSLSYRAAAYRGTTAPTITSPLDYEQKHRGSINVDYRFGENDGGPVFNNFGANVLFSFNSGHPYTKVYVPPGGQVDPYNVMVDYMNDTRQRQALEPFGASTTPWNFTTDLNLDKSFRVGDLIVATAYMRVTNLFNKKNVINVYQKTGSAVDDGFLNDPIYSGSFISQNGPDYVDMYRAVAQGDGNAYRGEVGNELFGTPRQIFFGIRVTY